MKTHFEKNPVLPIEKFPSPALPRNTIILQHLIIQFLFYYLSSGRSPDFGNKRKFQTFSSKSGRGQLLVVVAYKRFQIWGFDLKTFGILEWSLTRGTEGTTAMKQVRKKCFMTFPN